MLILLPPSEGKASPARGKSLDLDRLSSPVLAEARSQMLGTLVDLCTGGAPHDTPEQHQVTLERAAEVLGLGGTQHDLVARNAALHSAATARADHVYTGVLFDNLDFATLSPAAKRRATSRVAITSSLFGIVRPTDPIPSYRLSGDVTLPGLGSVSGFWRQHLGPAVEDALGSGLLVDLRSSTYAAFWRPPVELASRLATVRVLHEADGVRKVVSHFNKATKGRLVRQLLEDGRNPRTPQALADVLTDLGWHVEADAPNAKGTRLDVVVREL
ncbi:peroxide stress protein YaaA [Nocardioides alcanivorans]|uniref:peroxide stress protein YaaA n=1 Tax=Nocardioides alcanivorans TaxID=2897352 RepID=UPI001F37A278|nr:peroxide stress protein YaaA [Nocardioides alcanivorans]